MQNNIHKMQTKTLKKKKIINKMKKKPKMGGRKALRKGQKRK
jgi:hypothetical protein